jgi:hypothetical protein
MLVKLFQRGIISAVGAASGMILKNHAMIYDINLLSFAF